jgi:hypothetical protein
MRCRMHGVSTHVNEGGYVSVRPESIPKLTLCRPNVPANPDLHLELQWWANCLGLSGAPFDSYLTVRAYAPSTPE